MNKLLLYSLLALTILCTSSPATAYKSILSAPSPLLNLWRMEITCLAIFPGFIYECIVQPTKVSDLMTKYLYLPLLSGFAHSLYITFWVLSLSQTSIIQSVFFLSCTSALLTFTNLLLGRSVKSSDIAGTCITSSGLLILLLAVRDSTIMMQGSLISLGASFFYSIYWRAGNYALKDKNIPIWSYLWSLNCVSGICCWVYSYCFYDDGDILGWIDGKYVVIILWLGLVPSILANFSYNLILKSLDTYIVTCCVNFSPIVSAGIAVVFGFQDVPEVTVWIGGFVVLCGNMIVTLSKDEKKALQGVENVSNQFIYPSVVEEIMKSTDIIYNRHHPVISLDSEIEPSLPASPHSPHSVQYLHSAHSPHSNLHDFALIHNQLAKRVQRRKAAYYTSMFGM